MSYPNREKRQIIFDPKQPPGFSVPGKYNLWQGLDVLPQKGWGKQRRLLRHILQIICRRDRPSFKYLLRWLACSVQRPDEIPETVIVLKSREEGTGKSTLTLVMCKIFGKVHSRTISDSDLLVTRFNDDLENAVLWIHNSSQLATVMLDRRPRGFWVHLRTHAVQQTIIRSRQPHCSNMALSAMANLRPRDQHGLDPAERQREGPGALVTPPAISKQVSNST
jgi:hypothetical protein